MWGAHPCLRGCVDLFRAPRSPPPKCTLGSDFRHGPCALGAPSWASLTSSFLSPPSLLHQRQPGRAPDPGSRAGCCSHREGGWGPHGRGEFSLPPAPQPLGPGTGPRAGRAGSTPHSVPTETEARRLCASRDPHPPGPTRPSARPTSPPHPGGLRKAESAPPGLGALVKGPVGLVLLHWRLWEPALCPVTRGGRGVSPTAPLLARSPVGPSILCPPVRALLS